MMEYKTHVNWVKLMVVRDSGRPTLQKQQILSSDDVYSLTKTLMAYTDTLDREEFFIIGLDGKNRMTFAHSVSVGSLTASIIHPREVFKMAILGNAASIILAHNHPSGDTKPSPEDIDITNRLSTCGKLLGIKVLDHIILGDKNYLSFADKGLLLE